MQQRGGGRGRGRGRESDGDDLYKETVVKINRCAKVVKGGRRFSFSALVVVGDSSGSVGVGFGKATEVPPSIEKGIKIAKKSMKKISLDGGTIPHEIWGRFGAAKVLLMPAGKGTGVIASAPVRAVVGAAGIKDILTKSFGSNNPMNVVKATMKALEALRTKKEVERLRGVTIE
jgi:small subunit ribosomal protein S5